MEELARSKITPAGRVATDRLTMAALKPDLYPNGTAFLAADLPGFAKLIADGLAERRPLAILYPDGHEILVTPALGALAGLRARLSALFLGSRRPNGALVPSTDGEDGIQLPPACTVELRHPPAAP